MEHDITFRRQSISSAVSYKYFIAQQRYTQETWMAFLPLEVCNPTHGVLCIVSVSI